MPQNSKAWEHGDFWVIQCVKPFCELQRAFRLNLTNKKKYIIRKPISRFYLELALALSSKDF